MRKRVNEQLVDTEAKGSKKAEKNEKDLRCRFHFPRAIVLSTRVRYAYNMIDEEWLPSIELKRLDPRYNGTCTNLMLGTQSNSDISLFFTSNQVLKATIYHTGYATKAQPISEHISTKLSIALQRLNAEKEALPERKFETPAEHCRRFLCRILTGCEGLQERGALETVALLLGLPEGYCSHSFTKLFFSNTLYLLENLTGCAGERKETFSATHNNGSTTWSNQRIDYICCGPALGAMCLYEYALRVVEWTLNAAVKTGLDIYNWDEGHPRSGSHCQVISGYEQTPCLVGPGIPPRGRPDGIHERIALVLFKSHASIEELLPASSDSGEYDWAAAYAQLYAEAGVRVKQWLINMDQMASNGASEEPLGEQERCSDESEEKKAEGCDEAPDDVAADQAANERPLETENAVDLMNKPFEKQANADALITACGIPAVLPEGTQEIQLNAWDAIKHRAARQACADLKRMCDATRTQAVGGVEREDDADVMIVQGVAHEKVGAEVIELPNIAEVVADVSHNFTLNPEQDLALRVLATAFDEKTPRLMCNIPGPAGTGKTRVILAVIEVAKQLQKGVATSSPTGWQQS